MSRSHRGPIVLAMMLFVSSTSCQRTPPSPVKVNGPRTGVVEVEPLDEARVVTGQTIYVPAYSHVLTANDARPFNLAVTLSIRNTDPTHPIVVSTVAYYDRDGRKVRDYLKKPLRVAPLASIEFFVKEQDTSGGSSACFLVDWVAEQRVTSPLSETVMIGTASTQGISFTCSGRVIAERAP